MVRKITIEAWTGPWHIFGLNMHFLHNLTRKLKNINIFVSFSPIRVQIFPNIVSDCCLESTQQFFSYIMVRTSYLSMEWWWGPLCTRPICLFSIVLACLNNSLRIASFRHPDSEPTNLWSFSLILHTKQRSNKYQFHSLWLDPIGTQTHNLPLLK